MIRMKNHATVKLEGVYKYRNDPTEEGLDVLFVPWEYLVFSQHSE